MRQRLEEGVQVVGDRAVPGGDGHQDVVAAVELHAGDAALGELHAAHDQQVVALHHGHVLRGDDGDLLVVLQRQQQLADLEGHLALGHVTRRGAFGEVADDHRGAAAAEQVVAQEDALAGSVGGGQQTRAQIAGPVARVHGQYVEIGPGGCGTAAAEERHAAMVRGRTAVRTVGRTPPDRLRAPRPAASGSLLGGYGRDDRDRAVRVEQDRLGDRAHHAGGREQPAAVAAHHDQ